MYQLYTLVGEIDACIAIASQRAAIPKYCLPEFTSQLSVDALSIVHPLIKNAVPNSMSWHNNILITGSNASGKSTFIKAIALNTVLAQSIYTCWAEEFSMPRAKVMSSMALRDNV